MGPLDQELIKKPLGLSGFFTTSDSRFESADVWLAITLKGWLGAFLG